jgi:hypothetical protein
VAFRRLALSPTERLPNTPEGETKPIGFRLPPPMLAMIDREVNALRPDFDSSPRRLGTQQPEVTRISA